MIAAFGDLDVGGMPRRGEDARRQIVIEIRLERVALGCQAFAERGDLARVRWCRCTASTSGMFFWMSSR